MCIKGIGPEEIVLFDFRRDPSARSFVTERPIPPVALDKSKTSETVLPICSMSSCISIKKQFESFGFGVPEPMLEDPAERYSSADIFV